MDSERVHVMDWEEVRQEIRPTELLRATVLLILVRLSLVAFGFQKTALALRRLGRKRAAPEGADVDRVSATNYSISLAAALVPARMLCLERSLVLHHMLRNQGIGAGLRMGVRAFPFEAHAWVELGGAPINEVADHLKDFQPIFGLD